MGLAPTQVLQIVYRQHLSNNLLMEHFKLLP